MNKTDAEIEDIAERSARKALASFLYLIDVDVDEPTSVRNLRDTLIWAKETRESTKKVKASVLAGMGVLVLSAVSFFVYQAYEIFKAGISVVK
jgi:hypothetical protein